MNAIFSKIILRTFELMRPGEYPRDDDRKVLMRQIIWCLVNFAVTMIMMTFHAIRDGADTMVIIQFIVQIIESGYMVYCIRYKRMNLEVVRVLNMLFSLLNTALITGTSYELFSGDLIGDRYDDQVTVITIAASVLLIIIELYIKPLWRDRSRKNP